VAVEFADLWPLLLGLFSFGLSGGVTHCTGMCGPFVLAQTGALNDSRPALRRTVLRRTLLLPYHLGRMTTYAFMGALVGGAADLVVQTADVRHWLSFCLLALALLFAVQGLRGLSAWGLTLPIRLTPSLFRPLSELMIRAALGLTRPLRPLYARPGGWNGYALGLVLGLLPCGLIFGALTGAVSAGSAAGGFLAMAAFALGTMPALMGVGLVGGLAGGLARQSLSRLLPRLLPLLLLLNAALVARMALHGLS
jgi:uncharacterized protein